MSLGSEEHPRPEELLSFADGELSGKESAAVRAHLDACWQCRTELEHQQAAIRQFIDYRDQRVTPALPPWKANVVAFRQKLREVNASAHTSRSRSFVHRLQAMSTPGRAVAAGLALASVAFLWYVARPLPAVTANELLTRAAKSEEQSLPRPLRQTVRLRAGRHSITEQVWRGTVVPAGASHSAEQERISTALASAGWDPGDPLSARHFHRWRDQANRTKEAVSVSGQGLLTLTTSVSDTALSEASLTVRASDFHAVGQMLRFRRPASEDIAEISIEEVAWETATPPAPAVASIPKPATPPALTRPVHPTESRATLPTPEPSLDEQEAEVRWALHQLGLDVGDPVEVKHDGNRIVLENSGLASERLAQLKVALPDVAIVAAGSAESHAAGDGSVATTAAVTGQPLGAPLAWESKFHTAEERTEFANRVVELTEEALLRAHALSRLEGRYGPANLEKLAPATRGRILEMERDHAGAVCRQIARLRALLGPVLILPSSGTSPSEQKLLPLVQRMDRLANVLFARANTALTAEQVAAELAASLTEAQMLCSALKEVQ